MCYPFKIGCRSNGCCYLFTTKNQPFKRQGESDQIQLFVTLYICTMFKSKQTIPHTKVTVLSQNLSLLALLLGRCQDVCCFFHVCYTEINKQDAKTKQLAFTHFGTPGRQFTPFCSLLRFHLAKKGKLIANPQYL